MGIISLDYAKNHYAQTVTYKGKIHYIDSNGNINLDGNL
jgi:hypothetical protein